MTNRLFFKKKIKETLFVGFILLLFLFCSVVTQYNFIDGIKSIPQAVLWTFQNFVPNGESLEKLPKILSKLLDTVLISIAATTVAGILAFIFSIFGSKTTGKNAVLRFLVRIVASTFRNVPDVVWAMILLFSFGQTALTGYLALFLTTVGMLTRAFTETIDEASSSSVEALGATGANYIHIVVQSVIPSTMPQILSWILYMIETNIRSATLIGILTATGIGYLFDIYYKRLDYNGAGLIILTLVICVISLELLSSKIRKVIM